MASYKIRIGLKMECIIIIRTMRGMNGLFMKLGIVNKDQFFATLTRSEVEYMNRDYNPDRQLR